MPSALLTALALANEHGDAETALRVTGLDPDDNQRFGDLPEALLGLTEGRTHADALRQMLALGFLAGRVAPRPRPRRALDPSSFLMDRDLFVRAAEGRSILRLPWFEEGLFVGRALPEISEFPESVLRLWVDRCRAGLEGERSRFHFTSCGHRYTVDAVPVRGDEQDIVGVLAIAVPDPPPAGRLRRAAAYERAADALDDSARLAGHLADRSRAAGHHNEEDRERTAADRARHAAHRARAHGFRHRSSERSSGPE